MGGGTGDICSSSEEARLDVERLRAGIQSEIEGEYRDIELSKILMALESRERYSTKRKGIKLRVHQEGNYKRCVLTGDDLESISYTYGYKSVDYIFRTSQGGEIWATCPESLKPSIQASGRGSPQYVSVPARNFGKNAELRIGWTD